MATRLMTLAAILLFLTQQATAQLPGRIGGGSSLGAERQRPLPVDQAFPYFVSITDTRTLSVTWQIAPDHYLYRHQFGFAVKSSEGAQPVPVTFELPAGVAKNDQFFGDIEAYYDRVTATLSLDAALSSTATLVMHYQGCAEWGFCYPPQTAEYRLSP